MVRKLFITVLVGVLALAFSNISVASAGRAIQLNLIQDCSTGCSEGVDMLGPTGFGFINYNQDNTGALRLLVSLKNAEPNTTYSIYLICGPTHGTACNFIIVGSITTNRRGNGNSGAIIVPLSTLQGAPFGSGARTDHIDLIAPGGNAAGGVYVTTNVNYTVP